MPATKRIKRKYIFNLIILIFCVPLHVRKENLSNLLNIVVSRDRFVRASIAIKSLVRCLFLFHIPLLFSFSLFPFSLSLDFSTDRNYSMTKSQNLILAPTNLISWPYYTLAKLEKDSSKIKSNHSVRYIVPRFTRLRQRAHRIYSRGDIYIYIYKRLEAQINIVAVRNRRIDPSGVARFSHHSRAQRVKASSPLPLADDEDRWLRGFQNPSLSILFFSLVRAKNSRFLDWLFFLSPP